MNSERNDLAFNRLISRLHPPPIPVVSVILFQERVFSGGGAPPKAGSWQVIAASKAPLVYDSRYLTFGPGRQPRHRLGRRLFRRDGSAMPDLRARLDRGPRVAS